MEKHKVIIINEDDKLKIWLQSSHAERFEKLMRLWEINKMIKSAKIKHSN